MGIPLVGGSIGRYCGARDGSKGLRRCELFAMHCTVKTGDEISASYGIIDMDVST